jgi:hypothetical protein
VGALLDEGVVFVSRGSHEAPVANWRADVTEVCAECWNETLIPVLPVLVAFRGVLAFTGTFARDTEDVVRSPSGNVMENNLGRRAVITSDHVERPLELKATRALFERGGFLGFIVGNRNAKFCPHESLVADPVSFGEGIKFRKSFLPKHSVVAGNAFKKANPFRPL